MRNAIPRVAWPPIACFLTCMFRGESCHSVMVHYYYAKTVSVFADAYFRLADGKS